MDQTPIHELRPAAVFTALETTPQGLQPEEAARRISLYGVNSLVEAPRHSPWPLLLTHLVHPMALILWGAGGLALLAAQPGWALMIWLLVLVNAGLAFWSEYRARQVMTGLTGMLPNYARVVRAGRQVEILARDLVPGDVLVLDEGDHIPADGRVVEEYGLRTNNAALTGEAVPARKSADASLAPGLSELERPNLIFAGSSVSSGTGRAVVVSTGMLTQFGRIARLTQQVQEPPSPLQAEILRITRAVSIAALGIAVVVFLVGALDASIQMGWQNAFLLALGIFVATVPEGLPATITLSLAIAGQRLAQQGVLIKKLSTIERVGTISVICTDKSGTLTQNQMMVRNAWVSRRKLRISGTGYEPNGAYHHTAGNQALPAAELRALLTAAVLCNNSRLLPPTPEHQQWTSLGDQTEVALHVAALKAGIASTALSETLPRLHELPFDARRKRMSTIHRVADNRAVGLLAEQAAEQVVFVKGAPRETLALCTHILLDNKIQPLDAQLRAEILAANDEYASRALRVLALAQRQLPARTGGYSVERIEQNLTFLGLLAMMDPPRPEVAEAIQICRQAGIRMTMITGDYGLTAESMARRIGMLSSPEAQIVTGAELDEIDDTALNSLLSSGKELVFARMAPEHKLRLVAAFQALGEVVAVMGDGVNDAPALRKADIGIAMGLVGTDVAKEAADIILTNDNFLSIVSAIKEGRAIYDNLRKFITYIFASNVPEILPFVLRALFGVPLALTFKQILAIDLGTDLLPALALGREKPEPGIMQRPPRRRSQPIIDRALLLRAFLWLGMIEAALCYAGFYLTYAISGDQNFANLPMLNWLEEPTPDGIRTQTQDELAVTVFFAGVVVAQVGNAFACRTENLRGRILGWFSNSALLLGITIELILILLLVYFPPYQQFFGHVNIPPVYWLALVSYAPLLYGLDWVRKMILRRR